MALENMAQALEKQMAAIIEANTSISAARENDLAEPLIERLTLNEERIQGMISGIRKLILCQIH